MTQDRIQDAHKALRLQLAEANLEVARVQLELKGLQAKCEHPGMYTVSRCGESCWYCPDCGWES